LAKTLMSGAKQANQQLPVDLPVSVSTLTARFSPCRLRYQDSRRQSEWMWLMGPVVQRCYARSLLRHLQLLLLLPVLSVAKRCGVMQAQRAKRGTPMIAYSGYRQSTIELSEGRFDGRSA
jgi:hypothetical protein